MNDPTVERHPIETLASEFTDRLRAGEQPRVEEYVQNHPHVADEIRDLFPTIAAMEKLKTHKESRSGGRASLGPTRLEQLGDFRIVREIGRGGMGIVYEAEQLSLGRRVAVKVLPKQSLLDEKHLLRFRREAKTAAKLHHTNIVPVLGVGEHDGFHFIVMQYIRGVGLDEIIPQLADLGRQTPPTGVSAEEASEPSRRETQISSVARAIFHDEFRTQSVMADSSIVKSSALPESSLSENDSIGFELGPLSESTRNSKHLPTRSFVKFEGGASDSAAESPHLLGGSSDEHSCGELSLDDELASEPAAIMTMRINATYWRSVARIGAQVASALQYAHEHGTLHRDIKPANLLIDEQGIVWVADFGLAKAVEQDDVSRTGDVVGTLRYMAPEQLYGNAERRSDLFSLGLTLYELLTFRPAYDEADRKKCLFQRSVAPKPPLPRRMVPGVPRDLETIVLKAIAEEPQNRYATSAELAEDLERFLEDRPILARRATPLEHFWRWCRRNPAVACLSGIATSLLVLVAIVSTTGFLLTNEANKKANTALAGEKRERIRAEATSELAWDALDRIFARFAPQSVVSPEAMTLETAEGDELAVASPVVLSEQAAALLEELLTFYDKLAAQGDNDVAFQRRIADANRRVGAIQQRLGRSEQAGTAYERAIKIYSEIAAESQQLDIQVAVAALRNELGTIRAQQRKLSEASGQYEIARRQLETLAARSDDPTVRYELAHTYYLQSWPFMGRRRRSSDQNRDRGQARFDFLSNAISILESLNQEHPNHPEYEQLLAMTYIERAEERSREPMESKRAIGSAVSILTSLVARFPSNPDFRFALSTAYATEISDSRERTTLESREEITRLLAAQSILNELQREHPNVPEYVASEARLSERLGRLHARIGEFDQAVEHLEAGLKTQRGLALRHPGVHLYAMRLSFMRQSFASELRKQYEVTPDPQLLDKARELLATTLPRSLELMRSKEGDPRMKSFVAFGVLNNFREIEAMCVELGDEGGAAATRTAAANFREEFQIPDSSSRGGPREGGRGGRRGGSSRDGGSRQDSNGDDSRGGDDRRPAGD